MDSRYGERVTEKAPAEQVIREMIAEACPDASDQTVREATAAVLEVGAHRAPTAEDAETFRRRFADALHGVAPHTSDETRAARATDLKRRYEGGASIRELYEDGATIRELCELTGRSYGFVHRLLSETGADLRGRGGAVRKDRDQHPEGTTASARRTGAGPDAPTVQGSPRPALPTREQLVQELKALRRAGLAGLRAERYPALSTAALIGGSITGLEQAGGTETLLREAARRLGQDTSLGQAAMRAFGLLPGLRDGPAHDRRRAAAAAYGISTERYRKSQELLVMQQLADAVLSILRERQPTPETTTSHDPATNTPGNPALPGSANSAKR